MLLASLDILLENAPPLFVRKLLRFDRYSKKIWFVGVPRCVSNGNVFHGNLKIQDTRSRTYSGYFLSGISEHISRAHGSVLKRLRLFGEFRRFEQNYDF